MRNVKVTAISLARRNFKEKDKITTIITKEYGKFDIIAKGSQKVGSKLSGVCEPFTYSNIILSSLKDLAVISNADIKDTFPEIKSDLQKVSQAFYISELAVKTCPSWHPNPEIFNTLLSTLYIMENGTKGEIAARYFEIELISILGYKINCERCLCGKNCIFSEKVFFSPVVGSFLCKDCVNIHKSIGFPSAILSYIKALEVTLPQNIKNMMFSDAVISDLERLFKAHIVYRMDIEPKSSEFVNLTNSFDKT